MSKLVRLGIIVAASSTAAFVACSSPKKAPHLLADAPNGSNVDSAGSGSATCGIEAQLGTVTLAGSDQWGDYVPSGSGSNGSAVHEKYHLSAFLNQDAAPDVIRIQLYTNYGVFQNGFPTTLPAIVNIAGAETDFMSCGACVFVDTNFDQTNGFDPTNYFATSGTMTLTMITPTEVKGTLNGIHFSHVTMTPDGSSPNTPVDDGCASTLDSLAFDVTDFSAGSGSGSAVGTSSSFAGRGRPIELRIPTHLRR